MAIRNKGDFFTLNYLHLLKQTKKSIIQAHKIRLYHTSRLSLDSQTSTKSLCMVPSKF